MTDLEPMDASKKDNYSEEDWIALGRAWAEKAPEIKKWADEMREAFPGSTITYIGPADK